MPTYVGAASSEEMCYPHILLVVHGDAVTAVTRRGARRAASIAVTLRTRHHQTRRARPAALYSPSCLAAAPAMCRARHLMLLARPTRRAISARRPSLKRNGRCAAQPPWLTAARELGRSHHAAVATAETAYTAARPEARADPGAASARINEMIASASNTRPDVGAGALIPIRRHRCRRCRSPGSAACKICGP